jgi:hypothetical protein
MAKDVFCKRGNCKIILYNIRDSFAAVVIHFFTSEYRLKSNIDDIISDFCRGEFLPLAG